MNYDDDTSVPPSFEIEAGGSSQSYKAFKGYLAKGWSAKKIAAALREDHGVSGATEANIAQLMRHF